MRLTRFGIIMSMSRTRVWVLLSVLSMGLAHGAQVADESGWPRFRGPAGDGVTQAKGLPTKWSATNSVLWKADLPKAHNPYASPIVWKDRVFVATVSDTADSQKLLCFGASDGKLLWETAVAVGVQKQVDMRGGFNCSTPCTDGKTIYVAFGSCVLAAVNCADGKEIWKANLDGLKFAFCQSASPILYKNLVILSCEANGGSSLMAFDRATGEIKYRETRPAGRSHSTPILPTVDAQTPWLAVASPDGLYGLNPDTGKAIWFVQQASRGAKPYDDIASPIFVNGMIYSDIGREGTFSAVAVDAKSTNDIARNVKWKLNSLACYNTSSPVFCNGYLYHVSDGGLLHCVEMATGQSVYTKALAGVSSLASPVATADGLVYFASGGKSYVLKAGPTFEVVATNDLGDPGHASPAVAQGRLFIRGGTKLWCVGR